MSPPGAKGPKRGQKAQFGDFGPNTDQDYAGHRPALIEFLISPKDNSMQLFGAFPKRGVRQTWIILAYFGKYDESIFDCLRASYLHKQDQWSIAGPYVILKSVNAFHPINIDG